MSNNKKLDAKGLICPLPVLKARKILLSMEAEDILEVEFTDRSAVKDFPIFCGEFGCNLESIEEKTINGNNIFTAVIVL